MARDRIREKFAAIEQAGRPGLIIFLTAGFPDREATLALVPELVACGADCIELGVPFSDPLAEGPTIQESSFRALQQQVTRMRGIESGFREAEAFIRHVQSPQSQLPA